MAHVLVAHSDEGIREALITALQEAGHVVVGTADGELALTTLWMSTNPMVALLDERLSPFGGVMLIGVAANDYAHGPLSRHHYMLMSTAPDLLDAKGWELVSRLDVLVLSQPFDLDSLIEMVDEAPNRASLAGRYRPLPFRSRVPTGRR